jgi:hypothetical protein
MPKSDIRHNNQKSRFGGRYIVMPWSERGIINYVLPKNDQNLKKGNGKPEKMQSILKWKVEQWCSDLKETLQYNPPRSVAYKSL